MNKPNILVIDDEPQIRKLLDISLSSNGYKSILATNGVEGLRMANQFNPDLILLDIGLPDLNGHTVLDDLMLWFENPVIILSVQNNENDIVNALDHGATDYLTKPFRTAELMARIRSSLKRNAQHNNDSILTFDDLEIDLIARALKRNKELIKLTSTEYNLFLLLAMNAGKVLTHQFMLKKIWGISYQKETQYLRVYIGQLRKKIESDPNQSRHIITESGIGYRFI